MSRSRSTAAARSPSTRTRPARARSSRRGSRSPRPSPAGSEVRPRAAIVVTGSELVRGDRTDLNGPFLARQLLTLGLEPARISIVGDAPGELAAALGEGLQADLCVVSGGLGP